MKRFVVGCSIALALTASVASAQERSGSAGAGRVELMASPIGGVFFTSSETKNEPKFGNYGLGGAVTGNINPWFGIEGDVAYAVGVRQTLVFPNRTLVEQRSPSMLTYSGSLVYNPWGKDRRWVPYVAGGMGRLAIFNADDLDALDIPGTQHFTTTNLGGGLRFFADRNWGLRGDYRAIMTKGRDDGSITFGREDRLAHRVSGSVILTY